MINHNYEINIEGGDQRLWADICPDILKSIYAKLPSHVEGTEFGSVCKNWHKVHSIVALSSPLPIPRGCYRTFGVHMTMDDEYEIIRLTQRSIPDQQLRMECRYSSIVARAGGWWLLSFRGIIIGFFNPLLRYPANFIDLPNLEMHYWNYMNPWPIRVAFSALPTAPEWMILVVYGDRYFSTLRRSDKWFWKTYDFSMGGEREQICLGVGYRDDKFFCLFENGDMLIFSVHKDHTRMMLATDAPLSPQQLDRLESLHVVASCPCDETMVVSWERDYAAKEKNSFRLLRVEREAPEAVRLILENCDDGHETTEEGVRGVIVLVKEEVPLKTRNFEGLLDAIFGLSGSIIFVICIYFMSNGLAR